MFVNLKTLKTYDRFEGCKVRAEGIEPPRLAALDPKSSTSTSSATPAFLLEVKTLNVLSLNRVTKVVQEFYQPKL